MTIILCAQCTETESSLMHSISAITLGIPYVGLHDYECMCMLEMNSYNACNEWHPEDLIPVSRREKTVFYVNQSLTKFFTRRSTKHMPIHRKVLNPGFDIERKLIKLPQGDALRTMT